jgi:mannose-6-phosphate isomerase-like protein (cupin superfamily)
MQVIRSTDLPGDQIARDFIGRDHGGLGFTFILVDAGPSEGPKPHRHAYPEVLIVLEGIADATVDGKTMRVTAGDIVLVPTRSWHSFVNAGTGRLRQVDIHASSHFITEWQDQS